MGVLTVGDSPLRVSMMPCTIHGCRPTSVSSQPAVFIRNGSTTSQVAAHKNRRDLMTVPRRDSHTPHRATRVTMMAR